MTTHCTQQQTTVQPFMIAPYICNGLHCFTTSFNPPVSHCYLSLLSSSSAQLKTQNYHALTRVLTTIQWLSFLGSYFRTKSEQEGKKRKPGRTTAMGVGGGGGDAIM